MNKTQIYSEVESVALTFATSLLIAIGTSLDGQTVQWTWAFWGSIGIAALRAALKATYIKAIQPKVQ